MSEHGNHIGWLLKMSIKPGQGGGFEALSREMTESAQASEPRTMTYMWYRDGDHVQVYEHYVDSDAAMAHLGNFGQHFAERFFAMFDVTGFWVYGTPSDEVRLALSASNPRYLSSVAGFSR